MMDSERDEKLQDAVEEPEGKPMSKKTVLGASRDVGGSVIAVDPDVPVIIGYDTKHKQGEHPQWQHRASLPVDESLVQYMMAHGFPGIITVQKDGPNIIVVIGRQRVKAAREANNRLKEMGRPGIRVLCQTRKGTDAQLIASTISENAIKVKYGAMDQAYDAQNYINYGASDEDAARALGKTVPYTKKILTLLDLHPKVQQAIRDEAISAFAGFELTRLTRDEQLVELEKIKGGAYVPTAKNIDGAVKAIRNKSTTVTVAPGKSVLRKLYQHKEAKSILGTERYQMLEWFLGESQAPRVGGLKALLDELSAGKKKAEVEE